MAKKMKVFGLTTTLPEGGSPGQLLSKTESGEEWIDPPVSLPEGGETGQILSKTENGEEWVDLPEISEILEPLAITIAEIENSNSDVNTYTSSHTVEQIAEAISTGRKIYAVYNETIHYHAYTNVTVDTFGFSVAAGETISTILIANDGVTVTLSHLITRPAFISVGQTIVAKTVNEHGIATEWEAVDLPTGNNGDGSGSGTTTMPELGHALYYDEGNKLSVKMGSTTETDKTLPISVADVETTVGNIETLLSTI